MQSKIRARLGLGLLCLITGCATEGGELPAPRPSVIEQPIVGGAPAAPQQFPWFVSLRDAEGRHVCGGTLISPGWVLTAGHCLWSGSLHGGVEEVVVGGAPLSSDDGEHLPVERGIVHPDYNEDILFPENDVALLRLTVPSTAPVMRRAHESQARHLHPGTLLRVAGFGHTTEDSDEDSDTLLYADVPLVSRRECRRVYGNFLLDSMLCAGYAKGGVDSCQGDSGGPVFAHDAEGALQVAVVTGGIGCARPEWYGLYTNIALFDDWLTHTMAQGDADAETLAPCFAACEAQIVCADPTDWRCASKLEACRCGCGASMTPPLCAPLGSESGGGSVPDEDDGPTG